MGRHRLCDYCRLQGLKPSPFFFAKRGCNSCGAANLKIAGYAEAYAQPSLAASSILDKNKEWHANVPTKWVKRRSEASQHSLSFIDPLRKSRDSDEQGVCCRRLLRRNKLECCVFHPAPYRMCMFDCREATRGDVVATVHYDILKRYVNAVVVDDRWRRRGLSRLLLESALDHMDTVAPDRRHAPVTLYVTKDNTDEHPFLIGFYERQGFSLVDSAFGEMVRANASVGAAPVARPAPPPPSQICISEEMRTFDVAAPGGLGPYSSASLSMGSERGGQKPGGAPGRESAFFTAPLPVERFFDRPRPVARPASSPKRPARPAARPAWPARPATAPVRATDGFLANPRGGRAASAFRARVDAAHAAPVRPQTRVPRTRAATWVPPAAVAPPTRVRAATGDGPTRVRAAPRVTLDAYLGASPPRRPTHSPPPRSPPERKVPRRHSPILASASACQIRRHHREAQASPAARTVQSQSFRSYPDCPYKKSDKRREHLRRIMLNA